jgi:hypothetical protein
VRSRYGPTFECFLDDNAPAAGDAYLTLNPRAFLQYGTAPPPEIAHRVPYRGRLRPGFPIVWVEQAATEVLAPFWVPHAWARPVIGLFAGSVGPAELDSRIRAGLAAAGVLIADESTQDAPAGLDRGRHALARDGWTVLDQPIPTPQLNALRGYCRALVGSDRVRVGDEVCPERTVAHNEVVARFWHHQLTGLIARVAGEPLKPSYVYFASYAGGASLPVHVDREQCEVTVSLLVDFEPAPRGTSPWPLIVETPGGDVAIHQAIGDAAVLRGRRLPHRRDPLDAGRRSTSIFFHYVPTRFSGSLD